MKAVSSDQMRELDRRAQQEFGIPELILMEHAGTAAAREARRMVLPAPRSSGRILVLAGGGANGGDGLVAARHLSNWGLLVEVVLLSDPDRLRGASLINLEILRRMEIPLSPVSTVDEWNAWIHRKAGNRWGLIVDALLGTGLTGPVREPFRTAIRWINRKRIPVVSVDLPSGLNADTGAACGEAVRASVTVTCGLPKVGLRRAQGLLLSGRVKVADISLPRALWMSES